MSYGTLSKILGVDVEIVKTLAEGPEHELGLIVEADGTQYKYVQADSAVAQYDAVKIDSAAAGSGLTANVPFVVTPTAAADEVIAGVAQVAIAAGSYAFVAIKGKAVVKVAAGLTAEELLVTTATAGTLDGTAAAVGNALAAGTGVGVQSYTAIGTPAAGQARVVLS